MSTAPRRPIAELLSIALPTVATMASYTLMQFIDTWMLSRLGDGPPTAASNSGILAFSLISFGMGIVTIVNTLVSQSFGREDFHPCGRYLWQGIWIGLVFGILLLPLRELSGPIFRAFHHPPQQAAMEATYFSIVLAAASIKLVSAAIGNFSLGIDRPRTVLISAILGVCVNALAAYCIVLGHGGFQKHGVTGAAWAQNIGITFELLVLLTLTLRKDVREKFQTLQFSLRLREMMTLVRVGVPSGLQWFSDVLAWSIFCNLVIGVLGPTAMAANAFMLRYLVVSFLPVYGISTAVTALVGRYIGRKQPDVAAHRTHLAFGVALIYIGICGTFFITARGPLMRLFTHDPAVIRAGSTYMILAAIYEIADAMYIIYIGALRGAGDTFAPTMVVATFCWSVNVTGGYCVARWVPMLGYAGPWIVACVYGNIGGWYIFLRFRAGRWRQIHLDPEPVFNVQLASATLTA